LKCFFVIRKLRKLIYVSNMSTVTYVSEQLVTHVPGLYTGGFKGGKNKVALLNLFSYVPWSR
jgi:hypothetical protein